MAIFIVLWPYLLTAKLRCLQKNNIGHTKKGKRGAPSPRSAVPAKKSKVAKKPPVTAKKSSPKKKPVAKKSSPKKPAAKKAGGAKKKGKSRK